MTKEVKDDVMAVLMRQIDIGNYGLVGTRTYCDSTFQAAQRLARAGYTVTDRTVEHGGEVVFRIRRKHAARKVNGMYKELRPTLEPVTGEV